MDETDRSIDNLRSSDSDESVYRRLKECVGLRGHLQDELLRIEEMLAKDDPDFQVKPLLNLIYVLFRNSRKLTHSPKGSIESIN